MDFQEVATQQPPEPLSTLHPDGFKIFSHEAESPLPPVGRPARERPQRAPDTIEQTA
ncbi:hypothetical protein HUS84_22275 [Pseudomonas chlororaphis]|uniref:hypothetical protein n=1 Tax=Pseudomonas chlororaphis TaxID=587753 RepID=UPI001B33B6F3|nr:hypothetical protein [Pseudomonas chlororaphis]MBP5076659.1 hypothetical protein [Pseudomonas chlororaphis]